ncbi:MAG: macro domain-containing protein [Gemmatimonadota bacterium]
MRRGSLTDARSEAILRPIRSDLDPLTPAGRDLERAAGEGVRRRLEQIGEVPVGGAVVTPGGDLPAMLLIHAAIESQDEPVTRAGVERALTNGIRRAVEWGVGSLSLPPLGAGAGQLELETVVALMMDALRKAVLDAATLAEVEIVVETEYQETAFLQAV